MKKIVIISLFTAILISILLAFYSREDFYFIGITAFVAMLITIVSLSITVLLLILAKSEKNKKYIRASKYSVLISLLAMIIFGSIFIAAGIAEYDSRQATVFCDSLVEDLEKYKSINGSYPETISKILADDIELPAGIENYRFYETNGFVYRFVVPVIGPNANGLIYDSRDKEWVMIDFIFDLERL